MVISFRIRISHLKPDELSVDGARKMSKDIDIVKAEFRGEELYALLVRDQKQVWGLKRDMLEQQTKIEQISKAMTKLHEINLSYGYRMVQKYYSFAQKNSLTRTLAKTVHKFLGKKFGKNLAEPTFPAVECAEKVSKTKSKNIIFLAMIDWNYRYQRPQHIAQQLSQMGYHVYFFNPTFVYDAVEERDLLTIVTMQSKMPNINALSDDAEILNVMAKIEGFVLDREIQDAVVISEYPTWSPICKRLKEQYGFPVAFDYLDDVRDFTHLEHSGLLNECFDQMFRISDLVFASSQYLFDKAKQQNDHCVLLRNGTEFEHFYTAFGSKEKNTRPVIGYYGEISNWFDHKLIVYAAKALPDYDFVLIGNYTYGNVEELKKLSNVALLGEKPYRELPDYLKGFDVAVIPFDASRDLIKATNPVKFYEYLSAGKKVVATEIPELMPFRNQYVLLENDPVHFTSCLKDCVESKDGLCSAQERIRFAKENSWSERVKALSIELEKIRQ